MRHARFPGWVGPAFVVVAAALITAALLVGGPVLGFVAALVVAVALVAAAIGVDPRGFEAAWRGPAARRFLVPVAVAAPGVVLIVSASGTARVIGWGIVAIAAVLAVSLVFLEIGYSEDRAREAPPDHGR
jgi:hypothetical protein